MTIKYLYTAGVNDAAPPTLSSVENTYSMYLHSAGCHQKPGSQRSSHALSSFYKRIILNHYFYRYHTWVPGLPALRDPSPHSRASQLSPLKPTSSSNEGNPCVDESAIIRSTQVISRKVPAVVTRQPCLLSVQLVPVYQR